MIYYEQTHGNMEYICYVEYTILEPDKPDTFGEIPFENLEI